MRQRRKLRIGLLVVHRHRVGDFEFRRVSELVYVSGQPKAVLGWIDVGGIRTPVYICDLDPSKLKKAAAGDGRTFYYGETTVDPRYEDVRPDDGQLFPKHI